MLTQFFSPSEHCFNIIRKIENNFPHLYSQTCFCSKYGYLKNIDLSRNCQKLFEQDLWNFVDLVLNKIHVKRKMQAPLLMKLSETILQSYQQSAK